MTKPTDSAGISQQAEAEASKPDQAEDGKYVAYTTLTTLTLPFVSLDQAWDGWDQLSAKLKVIINMKQLLKNVQQKKRDKSANLGAQLGSVKPAAHWSDLDEKIAVENLACITTGLTDITKLYAAAAQHPMFVEGRLLIRLDLSGLYKLHSCCYAPHKSSNRRH